MKSLIAAAGVAAMLSLDVSACGGATTPSHTSQLMTPCPVPLGPLPTLVSPAAGATGVPDGNFTLTMTWSQTPLTTPPWTFALQPASGAIVPLGPFTQGATSASLTTYSANVPALAPNRVYTLTMTFSGSNCSGSPQRAGSFTTR